MKYSIKRINNWDFAKYGGKDMYDSFVPSSVKSLDKIPSNKLNLSLLKNSIKNTSIIFPYNEREYKSSDFICIGKELLDDGLNIKITKDRFIIEPLLWSKFGVLGCILPKYRTSDFDYYLDIFPHPNSGKPWFLTHISFPKTKEGYEALVKILTEFIVYIKNLIGIIVKANIVEITEDKKKEKTFSMPISPFSILAGGYLLFSSKISEYINNQLLSSSKLYSPNIMNKLVNYINKDGGVILFNGGPRSFYIKSNYYKKAEKQRIIKLGNSDKPKSWIDYAKIALLEHKDLICYSDLHLTVALAHEFGHYLVSKHWFFGKIQNTMILKKMSRNSSLITFISFLFGISGKVAAGFLSAMVMQMPMLIPEFAASWYGLRVMKEIGCTKEELDIARKDLKNAFLSYLHSATAISVTGVGTGDTIRQGILKYKNFSIKIPRKILGLESLKDPRIPKSKPDLRMNVWKRVVKIK